MRRTSHSSALRSCGLVWHPHGGQNVQANDCKTISTHISSGEARSRGSAPTNCTPRLVDINGFLLACMKYHETCRLKVAKLAPELRQLPSAVRSCSNSLSMPGSLRTELAFLLVIKSKQATTAKAVAVVPLRLLLGPNATALIPALSSSA